MIGQRREDDGWSASNIVIIKFTLISKYESLKYVICAIQEARLGQS